MADEEDFDVVDKPVVTKTRPTRLIEVREQAASKAKVEEIIELAQVVLDGMGAEINYKDVAIQLKRKLDETYKGTWHAIVGVHFGGNVTNDDDTLVNFKVDGVFYLVFRSGPPDRSAVMEEAAEGAE